MRLSTFSLGLDRNHRQQLIIASIFLGVTSWVESRNNIVQRTKWFSHLWFLFRVMANRKMIHLTNSSLILINLKSNYI